MKPSDQFMRALQLAECDVFGYNICFYGKSADYLFLIVPENGCEPFRWANKEHAMTALAFAYSMAKAARQ